MPVRQEEPMARREAEQRMTAQRAARREGPEVAPTRHDAAWDPKAPQRRKKMCTDAAHETKARWPEGLTAGGTANRRRSIAVK